MNEFFTFILSCLAGTCLQPSPDAVAKAQGEALKVIEMREDVINEHLREKYYGRSLSANYLASRFAQNRHDWDLAAELMVPIIKSSPDDTLLLNRAMVLAMGSGNMEKAIQFAHQIRSLNEQNNALANLMIALDFFQRGEYQQASDFILNSGDGSLSDFVLPLLDSWASAANGVLKTDNLNQNTIHLYHAILIAEYLGETEHIKYLLSQSLGADGLSLQDIERIADVYAHIGERESAIELYERLFEQWPENRILGNKLEAFRNSEDLKLLETVETPEQGLAKALYDMSRLLFQEQSDESARVFAHMALYVDPDMTNSKLLLGYITARNEHYEDAIAYYRDVDPNDPQYAESIRMAADLMENAGMIDEALLELDNLARQQNDIEAVIQTGDIYRRAEEFSKAVAKYNQAAALLGNDIPKEYWQLLYVRGISYERLGSWDAAEADLMQALEYQPNHPLILNYLGYAWADQGINLKKSLNYIRRAAALHPTDGYIIDSLGWVLYRMGQYEDALPHLERAVELLPYDSVINDHLGDVYWKVGRKLEARFQWQRAKNYSEDEELIAKLEEKLEIGLINVDEVQAAQNSTNDITTDTNLFKQ